MKNSADKAAAEVARILIYLQSRFSGFINEPSPDDPDFDMNRGFKTFPKRKKR
jgi:hypothetical protein